MDKRSFLSRNLRVQTHINTHAHNIYTYFVCLFFLGSRLAITELIAIENQFCQAVGAEVWCTKAFIWGKTSISDNKVKQLPQVLHISIIIFKVSVQFILADIIKKCFTIFLLLVFCGIQRSALNTFIFLQLSSIILSEK